MRETEIYLDGIPSEIKKKKWTYPLAKALLHTLATSWGKAFTEYVLIPKKRIANEKDSSGLDGLMDLRAIFLC